MCTCPCHNASNLLSAHNPSHQRHESYLLVKSVLKSWAYTLPGANTHSYVKSSKGRCIWLDLVILEVFSNLWFYDSMILGEMIPLLQQEPSPSLLRVCQRTKGPEQLGEVWKALLNAERWFLQWRQQTVAEHSPSRCKFWCWGCAE